MTGDGIHAILGIDPPGPCPMSELSSVHQVSEFEAGRAGGAPAQVILRLSSSEAGVPEPFETVLGDGRIVACRLPNPPQGWDAEPSEGTVCEQSGEGCCMGCGYDFLPVGPYTTAWSDGVLVLCFALSGNEELTSVVDGLQERGFGVELRSVRRASPSNWSDVRIVRLDSLTTRQQEVFETAMRNDYYDPDGISGAELADRLGISRSTLSEHLGIVERKVLSQLV